MTTLLAIAGAIVAFAAGWVVRRSAEPSATTPVTPAASTSLSLDDVLDDHPTGVVVADASGAVRFRNAAARSLGGTHVGVLIDEAIERHLLRARSGQPGEEVLEMYGPPKTVVVVEARPLADGGAIAFIEDVSEQRRTDQVRTDFVANISHELKTPIGAMSVLAETLIDETDSATIRRVVIRMMEEARRASRTVDDLMELSHIELGGEQNRGPVKVADIVSGALDRVTELASQRGISISTLDPVDADGARSETIVVHGDRRELISAVGNLVENAVKYSAEGGAVQVRARRTDDQVEISVVDQGIGIPQRDLDRIFERFYRVDRARSRATGGTGLGLSIVRHVATNHGGAVLVSSTEGEGSTFVLRLPASADPAVESTNQQHEGVA